ncbi:hypothetical protein H5410_013776 [Solanum commersonii]|uniref:Uncharacterized protein n=1 Tax=Solanum commersonii TaxID=4109 RepID=A0A9J5ZP59_SOLCO|nr:hypothetical protein H5410_013776 [Solanum commersonii]
MSSRAGKPSIFRFSYAIVHGYLVIHIESVGSHGQIDPFSKSNNPHSKKIAHFVDVRVLVHGFLVIQNFDVIFANSFHRRPLRP